MPEQRAHDVDSLDCWCGPRFYVPCDECDAEGSCWKCSAIENSDGTISYGLIEIDRATAEDDDVTCLIVHNDA